MGPVAEGVHRLGSTWVNFYLVEDQGAVTLVDGGLPGYFDQVPAALERMGRRLSDVKAIVLTHTHTDHLGVLPQVLEAGDIPVLVPAGEAAILRGEAKPVPPKGVLSSAWRLTMLRFVGHAATNKGLSNIKVADAQPYDADAGRLDVPGSPRVVPTPGHSSAHCSLMFDERRVLICGDALATFAVDTGRRGPMIHPFNEDEEMARDSLSALAGLDAELLLPGHGEPWRGTMESAVEQARTR